MKTFNSKQFINLILSFVIILLLASFFFLFGKTKNEETIMPVVKIKDSRNSHNSLSIETTSYTLRKKERLQIIYKANNSKMSDKYVNKQIVFSTSDKKVVKVDSSGLIKAVGPGFASITIKLGDLIKTISVEVASTNHQVNVKEYGAHGDGIHDDTKAFQRAIDDLASKGGGNVFIPKGNYDLQPIFLKSNVNLVGENRDTVSLKLSDRAKDDYTRLINLINVQNNKIQNITFDGNSKNHPNGIEHMHCIFTWDVKNILIDNNRLINAVGDGISISGSRKTSEYVIISNNILEDNRRSNIVLEQVNHLQIFNNVSTSKIGRPALHFEPWEKMSFYDAKIWNNTFTSNTEGYCVQLEGGKDENNFYHEVEYYKNTVKCPKGEFLVMETKGAKIHDNKLNVRSLFVWIKNEDLNINNNEIDSKNGIIIEGTWGMNSKRTAITDNNILTSGYGVHIIAGSQDTTINRNTLIGKGGTAVSFFASVTDVTNTVVSDNTIKNFEYGILTDYNIYDDKRINGLLVRGNTFTDFDEYALFLKGTTQNVIVDNNVINNASGVYITANDRLMYNIKITNNKISGGKRGIIQNQHGNGYLKKIMISGNTISNTTYKGDGTLTGAAIELDRNTNPPTEVTIRGNTLKNNAINNISVPDSLQNNVYDNFYK